MWKQRLWQSLCGSKVMAVNLRGNNDMTEIDAGANTGTENIMRE